MDEVTRTTRVYEADSDAFVEKYEAESVAARFWEDVDAAMPGARVLDAGCGPGVDTAVFADRGYAPVGLDLTRGFVERASETVDAPFVRGDMRALPFASNAFDGVFASASLLHVPRPDVPGTLREFRRVLDAPGALVATLKHDDYDRDEYDTDVDDDRHLERYTRDDLHALATDAGFDTVDVDHSGDRWLNCIARVTD
jgi:ubiquinone/menaquinone biosynthesis C-methylase UbiE